MTAAEYDRQHWVDLVQTIIDRIGVEAFMLIVGQVVEQDIDRIIAQTKEKAQ